MARLQLVLLFAAGADIIDGWSVDDCNAPGYVIEENVGACADEDRRILTIDGCQEAHNAYAKACPDWKTSQVGHVENWEGPLGCHFQFREPNDYDFQMNGQEPGKFVEGHQPLLLFPSR
eukprot:gnl/TRDRNA2_/TRDRNA2_119911_c0_seq2.p1 gnl/TRDRNA2_/TRDRNA2_119911_c0~~gnl/TRDRNA2_/TRDRNA2_119911_c0_seq2.p1  ORF type:complete len:135 (+),score=16.67 gnl/TRDRNA2_/TRDRNA2_119911_c0_seq2:49-405(+)